MAPKPLLAEWIDAPKSILGALKTMMASPHLCSRRWVWEQYDHMVMGDTVARPGGDAAIVRVHGTDKGIAVTCDVTPRYCAADPEMGAKQAVAETWRNLTAVGADPIAITDNLNFGNPERPRSWASSSVPSKAWPRPAACSNTPSFPATCRFTTKRRDRHPPTPAIGAVGLVPDIARKADPCPYGRRQPADRGRPRVGAPEPVPLSADCHRQAARWPAAGRSRR